jgi:hypothetical protein
MTASKGVSARLASPWALFAGGGVVVAAWAIGIGVGVLPRGTLIAPAFLYATYILPRGVRGLQARGYRGVRHTALGDSVIGRFRPAHLRSGWLGLVSGGLFVATTALFVLTGIAAFARGCLGWGRFAADSRDCGCARRVQLASETARCIFVRAQHVQWRMTSLWPWQASS